MSDHAATAIDQLAVADCLVETRADQFAHALAAAQVHALLAVAEAVQDAAVPSEVEWVPASEVAAEVAAGMRKFNSP